MAARALAHVVPQQQHFCSLSSLTASGGDSHSRPTASLVTFKPLVSRKHGGGVSHALRATTTAPLLSRTVAAPAAQSERRACRIRAATARDNGFGADGGSESRPTGNQKKRNAVREFALRPFVERRALKIISGLQNLDAENVAAVVAAADQGGATHVDIACDPELVRMALEITTLPVCVSSVEPELFIAAVDAGAHMVEIGNYDSFYKDGRTFSTAEVLDLTCRTRQLLPRIALSVTIPHTLPLDEQVSVVRLDEENCLAEASQGGWRGRKERMVSSKSGLLSCLSTRNADDDEGMSRRSAGDEAMQLRKSKSTAMSSWLSSLRSSMMSHSQMAMALLATLTWESAVLPLPAAASPVTQFLPHINDGMRGIKRAAAAYHSTDISPLYMLAAAELDPGTAIVLTAILRPVFAVLSSLFVLRIVMSWYPQLPVNEFPYVLVYAPTEPVLAPTRRLIRPVGGVDISPVVWFALVSFANEILLGPQGLLVLLAQQQ